MSSSAVKHWPDNESVYLSPNYIFQAAWTRTSSLSLVSALLPAVVQTTSNTILVYQSHPYIQVPMMNVLLEFWKAWWPIFWIEYFLEFIAK